MATQTQTTQTATDDAAPESPRRFAWLFNHGWLIAGGLLVLLMVPAEADKAESASMRDNRDRIAEMSRSERQRVEFNFEEYRKLTPQQRRDVKALHGDVEKNPELAETLAAWHQWLAGLNFEDREHILQTTDPAARLALVRDIRTRGMPMKSSGAEPQVRPEKYSGTRNVRLPSGAAEFNALIEAIAEYLERPEHHRETTLEGRMTYHASIVAELLRRIREDIVQDKPPIKPADRLRLTLPEELRRKLLEALDPVRRRSIIQQGKAEQDRALAMMIIMGFYRELQVVTDRLKPDQDMLDFYLKLPEEQRLELDKLPAQQFARRVDELWLAKELPELARHVQEIRRLMPAKVNPRQGFQQNGNRPFSNGARRKNGVLDNRINQ